LAGGGDFWNGTFFVYFCFRLHFGSLANQKTGGDSAGKVGWRVRHPTLPALFCFGYK